MQAFLVFLDVEGPILIEVAAEVYGPQLDDGLGHRFGPAHARRSMRSLMRFLQAPSTEPLARSEEHTSELQSRSDLVCRLLLEKKKKTKPILIHALVL